MRLPVASVEGTVFSDAAAAHRSHHDDVASSVWHLVAAASPSHLPWFSRSLLQPPAKLRLPCSAADDGDAASGSEDEVEDENDVGHRVNARKQRQRVRSWEG